MCLIANMYNFESVLILVHIIVDMFEVDPHSIQYEKFLPVKSTNYFSPYIKLQFVSIHFIFGIKHNLFLLKVFLGDPHSCTCPTFVKEKDLCIHILWYVF